MLPTWPRRGTSGAILKGAKTLTQMAAELDTIKTIVRRWLRRDHWDLWMEHWALVEEMWEAGERDRQRQVGRLADGQRSSEIKAALDLSLARPPVAMNPMVS